MEYWNTYKTKIGTLIIVENEDRISKIETVKTNMEYSKGEKVETQLIKKAYEQITEYLEGKRKEFTLPLLIKGTTFQEKAVVGACHNNPIMIVVPCHRVIGSNKKLVGYAGGLDIKEMLLKLEQK